MKALSLTQPWASLCVAPRPGNRRTPVKPIETRSWYVRPDHLPMRLAIHAAKGINRVLRANITHRSMSLNVRTFSGQYAEALAIAGLSPLDPWMTTGAGAGGGVPLGAIIGCVTLERCMPADMITDQWKTGVVDDLTYRLGDFSSGRWGWLFMRPFMLETPIVIGGAQGLWTVPPPIALELERLDPHFYDGERRLCKPFTT